ncbi:hypothetical protein Pmani_008328 [Petrolisthes manimaculis]|uniref:Uncharacterized protein n=1 Tax=Petrolisthes manimaculis TaxID=1843537 RepID=A0AAE1Q8V1_9EUCA|nr:hypothetical protein Pmani_008328 [Petrolisthes manimaculis]
MGEGQKGRLSECESNASQSAGFTPAASGGGKGGGLVEENDGEGELRERWWRKRREVMVDTSSAGLSVFLVLVYPSTPRHYQHPNLLTKILSKWYRTRGRAEE